MAGSPVARKSLAFSLRDRHDIEWRDARSLRRAGDQVGFAAVMTIAAASDWGLEGPPAERRRPVAIAFVDVVGCLILMVSDERATYTRWMALLRSLIACCLKKVVPNVIVVGPVVSPSLYILFAERIAKLRQVLGVHNPRIPSAAGAPRKRHSPCCCGGTSSRGPPAAAAPRLVGSRRRGIPTARRWLVRDSSR